MIQFTKWCGLCPKTNYSLEKILFPQTLLNADLLSVATMLFNLTGFKNGRTSYRTPGPPTRIARSQIKYVWTNQNNINNNKIPCELDYLGTKLLSTVNQSYDDPSCVSVPCPVPSPVYKHTTIQQVDATLSENYLHLVKKERYPALPEESMHSS